MKVRAVGKPCHGGNPGESYLIGSDEFPDVLDNFSFYSYIYDYRDKYYICNMKSRQVDYSSSSVLMDKVSRLFHPV